MWVCLCKAVTDQQIRAAVRAGALSLPEIALACRAGSGCGGCLPELTRIVNDELARQAFLADAGIPSLPGRRRVAG